MKKISINNEGEIYVMSQPKHIIASIILMDTSYPLEKETHDAIFKLGEISDLIFIFSSRDFPVEISGIKKDKFTTLYKGCAFMEVGNYGISLGVMKMLSYCKEVFDKHLGYCISMSSLLGNIKDEDIDNIIKVQSSSIIKPIFKYSRLSSEEMYKFYAITEKEKDRKAIKIFSMNNFGMDFFVERLLRDEYIEQDCRYCTWKSDSSLMYFKNGVINTFLDRLKENDTYQIVKTFTDTDIRYLFTNLTKICGIDIVNYNIGELEIGKL